LIYVEAVEFAVQSHTAAVRFSDGQKLTKSC